MTDPARPWPPGAATAIGSMPGTDPAETLRLVFGELPDLPFLPELPARGAGADMIGRGAALLVDLPVEIQPSGWRFTARPGRELRRARDFLSYDLEALGTEAGDYAGPLKIQCAGPVTLAASVELAGGHRAISDHGAVVDIADSLAAGLRAHITSVLSAVPQATVVLQLDEPALPMALAGAVPTASGYGTVRALPQPTATELIGAVLTVAEPGARVVHCCADGVPMALLRAARADAISVDLDHAPALDDIGEAVDGGVSLWLGAVPSVGAAPGFGAVRDRITELWNTLGFSLSELAGNVVPTPACGLAGGTDECARAALTAVRDAGRALTDLS